MFFGDMVAHPLKGCQYLVGLTSSLYCAIRQKIGLQIFKRPYPVFTHPVNI